ncbi:unnamed protein product [Fraxinus pennsylvanica]|uniref:non-specific serine/threonine protein kinase n=1 Tax=Fraxinus pennsylvanica TaxID=56036 RepID=A0AAD2E656_9LAMI|nr:unnamed protein product [Fraxinus pennsylvanica]
MTCRCELSIEGVWCQKTHPGEVHALRAVKKSLIDPYKNLGSWNKGDPCTSEWTGIFCCNATPGDYLHVCEMSLLNMNLSGRLSPELVHLSYMKIMDFMWNNISGTIPKEIGNITSLELLLLNGNNLTGSLPDEIGYLRNLDRLQIDENQISGSIPKSLANLTNAKHFHMNNNSLSGQIPPELSSLPNLVHLLLDNNNLSGRLPPELSKMPNLMIIQLDNNNFEGSTIPLSYGNISRLLKLSLRNCSLQGPIPNWSNMPNISFIDLSLNKLSGTIPAGVLSENMTTIDLSYNNLNGNIPATFSKLPLLQKLSLASNSLSGSVPSAIWQNRLNQSETLILDFRNNRLINISGSLVVPPNVTVSLQGNPICTKGNLTQFCGSYEEDFSEMFNLTSSNACDPQSCPPPYEYAPASPVARCFCSAPLLVGYRLKSPGFTNFLPYIDEYKNYVSSALSLNIYQFDIDSVAWQKGPRLKMYLKIFPVYINNSIHLFNKSEIIRIRGLFSGWRIHGNAVFGPFELLNFTLLEPYKNEFPSSSPSGISKGALAGIILGTVAGSVTLSAVVFLLLFRSHTRRHRAYSKRRPSSRVRIRIDGVKDFTYGSLPDEIGYLRNLDRLQIDENQISGSIPKSLANLKSAKHFHMNNNSLSGEIPPELSRLANLVHLLLDNNNLSGHLPPELSKMPNLMILQLDNNNFEGSTIPLSYGNISFLSKLSLRNCSLQGPIPNWSNMPNIAFIDLSLNKLSGTIPVGVLPENITTIDLSYNNLNGPIPASFSRLPLLQKLSLANNSLSGSVPSTIWQNRILNKSETLILDFRNNSLSSISGSGSLILPLNVTVSLQGNPICTKGNLIRFCGSYEEDFSDKFNLTSSNACDPQSCPPPYEYAPASPDARCFCALPLLVGYRLKSPGFTKFGPYIDKFELYVSSALSLSNYQFDIDSVVWQKGPRLRMYLKIFPAYINDKIHRFNRSEILRIRGMFSGWEIHGNAVYGPFELLNFTLLEPYKDEFPYSSPSGISKGALAGIILGTVAGSVTLSAVVFLLFFRYHTRRHRADSKRRPSSRDRIRIDGVKDFTYEGEQMLIYEFMSNGNLRDHISGNSKVPLTFAMRLRIALASAKVPDTEGLVPSHVSTVVKGTPGYLDPEYFLTHKLTDKSDVYSLGVVFLELLTGMHPIYHGKNIVREVNIAYSSGVIFSIIDERMGYCPSDCAVKFIKLALNCCHDDTDTRPSMVEVVRELESIWLMMPESVTTMPESVVSDPEKIFTPSSSSSTLKTSYASQDISGSDLASGVFHTVRPR